MCNCESHRTSVATCTCLCADHDGLWDAGTRLLRETVRAQQENIRNLADAGDSTADAVQSLTEGVERLLDVSKLQSARIDRLGAEPEPEPEPEPEETRGDAVIDRYGARWEREGSRWSRPHIHKGAWVGSVTVSQDELNSRGPLTTEATKTLLGVVTPPPKFPLAEETGIEYELRNARRRIEELEGKNERLLASVVDLEEANERLRASVVDPERVCEEPLGPMKIGTNCERCSHPAVAHANNGPCIMCWMGANGGVAATE